MAMTSIERVGAAITHGAVDRVPVDLHDFLPAAKASRRPLGEVLGDGEALAEAMLLAWREFGHDMILLENGTACSAQACGAEVVSSDLRLNPHLHVVALDGAWHEEGGELCWQELGHLQTSEVGAVLESTVRRIERHLRRTSPPPPSRARRHPPGRSG